MFSAFLSILYLRCGSLSALCLLVVCRLSILYLRCCRKPRALAQGRAAPSFNSLFEMPQRACPAQFCQRSRLSILYLRCSTTNTCRIIAKPPTLSILYLRCGPAPRPRRRFAGNFSFNSLFEMLVSAVSSDRLRLRRTFQFSI